MTQLSDIVDVTITANTRTPTEQGFGTALLWGYHTRFADLVRTYTSLPAMVADGFTTGDALYQMAEALLSQSPRPASFKVGRVTAAPSQSDAITVLTTVEGAHIILDVTVAGVKTRIDYTVLAAATTTTVATAVELLIEAIAGVNSSSSTSIVTATPAVAGTAIFVEPVSGVSVSENATLGTYVSDLVTLEIADNAFFYIVPDICSAAIVEGLAAHAESVKKVLVYQSNDTANLTGAGLFGDIAALAYEFSVGIYHKQISQFAHAAYVGKMAPKQPGSATWKFKSLAGVTASALSTSEENEILTANANFSVALNGLNITREGTTASGEFVDIIVGIEWLTARIKERVFAILANADKVPYTDASVDIIVNEILATMGEGVTNNFLVAGTLAASGPLVADVSTANKAARTLPDVFFSADLAGAIHKTTIQGTLSV